MPIILTIDVLNVLQKLLVLCCIAIPPWICFMKYFKARMNKLVIGILFVLYLFATDFSSEFLPFILAITTIILVYKTNNQDEIYYFRPVKGKRAEVLILSIGFRLIIGIINAWFALFLTGYGVKLKGQQITTELMNSDWRYVALLSVLAIIVAPILEEFIFRHTMYRQISKKHGKVIACLISSILFALLHFNFLGTISFLGVAVFNCYLYDKYGYKAAVFNHFLFNFSSTATIIVAKLAKQI